MISFSFLLYLHPENKTPPPKKKQHKQITTTHEQTSNQQGNWKEEKGRGRKKGDIQSKGNLPVRLQKVKKEAKQKWLEETNTN